MLGADTLRDDREHILMVSFTVTGGRQQDSVTHMIHLIVEEEPYEQNARRSESVGAGALSWCEVVPGRLTEA